MQYRVLRAIAERALVTLEDHETAAAQIGIPSPALRDRLISAALSALEELTPARLITAMGTRDIAQRAGASASSIFHHFGSVESFADAVMERVFDARTSPVESINDLLRNIGQSQIPVDTSRAFHAAEFRRLVADPELRLRVGLWALGGESGDRHYGRYLAAVDSKIESFVSRLFAAWGRELRPPWTMRSFIASHVALVNGSVTRHLVDPVVSEEDVFARAATALSMVSLRPIGDHRDLDDQLAEMNYYPLQQTRNLDSAQTRSRTQAIIRHAANLFARHGYRNTKLAQVARAAGIAESTLYSYFPTKQQLAAALFRTKVEQDIPELSSGAGNPRERLAAFVTDFAVLVARNIDLGAAFAAVLASDDVGPAVDVLRRTASLLDGLVEDEDAICISQLILIGIISRRMHLPAEPPALTAARVLGMFGI